MENKSYTFLYEYEWINASTNSRIQQRNGTSSRDLELTLDKECNFGDILTVSFGGGRCLYMMKKSPDSWLSVSAAQQGHQVIYSDHGGLQHQQAEEDGETQTPHTIW